MSQIINIGGSKLRLYGNGPAHNLSQLNTRDWRDLCDCVADDNMVSYFLFRATAKTACIIYCYQGTPLSIDWLADGETPEQYIADSYNGDGELAEYLSGLGFNGKHVLDVVVASHDGPCRVWCEPQYLHGTYNAPVDGFARDDGDAIIEFASGKDAQAYIDDYYNEPSAYDGVRECNVLCHGQAGADILTIVAA